MAYYRDTPSEQQDVAQGEFGPAGVALKPAELCGYGFEAATGDPLEWRDRICRAFGARHMSTATFFLNQLMALCTISHDRVNNLWKPSELELNFAVGLIDSIKPRNQMEAALAAQMVAVHFMQMRMSSRVLAEQDVDARDANAREASVAGKLARTYAMQLDTLARMRGRGTSRQTIKVKKELHQHVHYHDHRGDRGTGAEPHTASAIVGGSDVSPRRAALPGQDQTGAVVPLAGRQRKAGV